VWCCEAPKYSFCQNHSGSQWFCQPHRQSKHRAIGSKERNNLNPLNLNPIALKRCNDYRAVWSKCKIQLDPLVLRSNSSCAVIEEDNYNNQNSKFNSTSNKMHHQFQISALRLLVFHNTQIHNENSQGRDYELSPTTNKWHHKL
jgi:hypothetical protein